MSCEETREQLLILAVSEHATLEHLEGCARCREIAEQIAHDEAEMHDRIAQWVAQPPVLQRTEWGRWLGVALVLLAVGATLALVARQLLGVGEVPHVAAPRPEPIEVLEPGESVEPVRDEIEADERSRVEAVRRAMEEKSRGRPRPSPTPTGTSTPRTAPAPAPSPSPGPSPAPRPVRSSPQPALPSKPR